MEVKSTETSSSSLQLITASSTLFKHMSKSFQHSFELLQLSLIPFNRGQIHFNPGLDQLSLGSNKLRGQKVRLIIVLCKLFRASFN